MTAEWTDASCVDYTNYTSPFYLCIIHDCTHQISGAYIFAYEQLNKSLLQQHRHRLLSAPSPPCCCPTKYCRVWHKYWPTTVRQQMLSNNCWPTFVGRVSVALQMRESREHIVTYSWGCNLLIDDFIPLQLSGRRHYVFLLFMSEWVCVPNAVVKNTILKSIGGIYTKLSPLVQIGVRRVNASSFWGQNVIVQGHSGVQHAGRCT